MSEKNKAEATVTLPSKRQIEAAVRAVKRTHIGFGYARPLKDRYAETIAWAAICAVLATPTDEIT